MKLRSMVIQWVMTALAVFLAAATSSGIEYRDNQTLIVVVVLLSLLNMFLKPLMILFTLPFVIMTMGLGLWIINGLLLYFVAWLVNGFEITSFWAALWGALLISLVSGVSSLLFGDQQKSRLVVSSNRGKRVSGSSRKGPKPPKGDVIDV